MNAKIIRRASLVLGDSRWWHFYLQRRFMKPAMRNWLADRATRLRPPAAQAQWTEHALRARDALGKAGIAVLRNLLSPTECSELRNYFSHCELIDSYRPGSARFLPDSEMRHPDAHVAHHLPQDVLRAPHLLALANDPCILTIASDYLGCKPTIGYISAWWSYHTSKGPQQAELFHRDVDDWKFLKFFVYLTDVTADSGPHVYVQHSANSPLLRAIRRFSDDEVSDAFGAENILTVLGEAGTGFLENTFGFHKGQSVERGPRLAFQVVYSMSPLPYSPKSPVLSRAEVTTSNIDSWINRVYIK